METNETMINDEQELNDVEAVDTDEVCEQDYPETEESGIDGLSFALGSVAALLVVKAVKKVVNSEPVQNKISEVKANFAKRKEARLAAKEAKKLKVGEPAADVKEGEVENTVTGKVINGK